MTVSLDGTWPRRGHNSHNGVVTCISTETGKCIDTEIFTNYCGVCDKGNEDSDHDCALNHDGTSGSMEPAGAVSIFKRSIDLHGIKYKCDPSHRNG